MLARSTYSAVVSLEEPPAVTEWDPADDPSYGPQRRAKIIMTVVPSAIGLGSLVLMCLAFGWVIGPMADDWSHMP
jgi:hypothetical protein